MTPRELKAVIMADTDCAPHVVTDAMEKVEGAVACAKDAMIADILNAKRVGETSTEVQAWLAKKILIKRGKWRGIALAAQDDAHPAVEAAYAAVALAEDARISADFADPQAALIMQALVDHALMTEQDAADIRALSIVRSAITPADVSRALRGPWE